MTYQLSWLPNVLLEAGLKVAQTPDWQSRGRGPMGTLRGVMCHHTATAARGNMPSLHLLIAGRPDLPGPLAQLGLGRDGCFYVIAAGRANHAGQGVWEGIRNGNSGFIGIEAENDGQDEPWPAVQMEAYHRGVAAILKRIGVGANMCCGHKEYAEPHGRKVDPTFDMPTFRREVAAFMMGRTPKPPIPASDTEQRPTLRRGSKGEFVSRAQNLLSVGADAFFGPQTEAALRKFQRKADLVPDGILGPKSWTALVSDTVSLAPVSPVAPAPIATLDIPPAATVSPPDLPPPDTPTQRVTIEGRRALGPDGAKFAITQGRGFYTLGRTTLASWLAAGPPLPPTITAPVRKVVAAMSSVEGGLEAVNSYDDAHMSFGVFQWTVGVDNAEGELAALLGQFKAVDPAAFYDCFGRYGLDVATTRADAHTGFLTLDGTLLDTGAAKDQLREVEWSYRFWRAGHHEALRACQFILAASRIDRFKIVPVHDRPLRQWMTSELAIALVLDEHVNRPAHVPATLSAAIVQAGVQMSDPTAWSDSDEHRLIETYLSQRAATNMTDSYGRARKIESMNTLSENRGTFD